MPEETPFLCHEPYLIKLATSLIVVEQLGSLMVTLDSLCRQLFTRKLSFHLTYLVSSCLQRESSTFHDYRSN